MSSKVAVKLMVDNEESRVVLAESGADFVDILFSFLTMPLGTVIQVLENKSTSWLGSFVNIHQSVADLDARYFWTEACKTMLLHPRNSAEHKCEDLAVNIDDAKPRSCFGCKDCRAKSKSLYSSIPGTRCSCGQLMSYDAEWPRTNEKDRGDGVFVNGELTFSITDDLNVANPSTALLMRMLKKMEVEHAGTLEERVLELGLEEIASLLWRTLASTRPLTDLCFNAPEEEVPARGLMEDGIQHKQESESSDADCNSKEIKLKLVLDKQSNKLVFAESEEDMVDLLFGWLTFPLGLLTKHAKGLPRGCIGNLCESLECQGLMRLEECKSMLLSPKLATFHGCSHQLLNAEESVPTNKLMVNPRSPKNGTESGGGFVRGSRKYMVTDDLRVLPFTQRSFVQMLGDLKVPTSRIVEREVSLGETQARDLLRAAFASRTALSDVFPPVKKHRGRRNM